MQIVQSIQEIVGQDATTVEAGSATPLWLSAEYVDILKNQDSIK